MKTPPQLCFGWVGASGTENIKYNKKYISKIQEQTLVYCQSREENWKESKQRYK